MIRRINGKKIIIMEPVVAVQMVKKKVDNSIFYCHEFIDLIHNLDNEQLSKFIKRNKKYMGKLDKNVVKYLYSLNDSKVNSFLLHINR